MSDESTPAILARLRGRLRSDRFDTILVKRADLERLVAMAESAGRLAECMEEAADELYEEPTLYDSVADRMRLVAVEYRAAEEGGNDGD